MRKIILFTICCIAGINAFAQNEASNWYFGENAGINFNPDNGSVTTLDDGNLNTREGCASISDEDGNLLFYTDGITVYNRNHGIMIGGNGLAGDSSSTQSAIIVPAPERPNIYYIFTVGSNLNPTGLKYSIVDLSLNNGLGALISVNSNLLNQCAEKVSAVAKDCFSGDVWIIAFADSNGLSNTSFNTFHAFELSDQGLNSNAVKSSFNINIQDSRGYLKLSPNGSKLACANARDGLYLFDFNPLTGIVSNPNVLGISSGANFPYGVEFSPNSQYLYVSSSNDNFDNNADNPTSHSSSLIQYDLNSTNITGSQSILDSRQLFRGGLQQGPDGKIYRALSATYDIGSQYLGVINNPNEPGIAANYEHNAVFLGNNLSNQGLPPFVQSIFTEKMDIIRNGSSSNILTLCEGDRYKLISDEIPGAIYVWTRNEKVIGDGEYFFEVFEQGDYELTIQVDPNDSCNIIKGNAYVNYVTTPEVQNTKLVQCEDDVYDGITSFNLNDAIESIIGFRSNISVSFYLSLNDAQNNSNRLNANSYRNISNPQTIYVSAVNSGLLNQPLDRAAVDKNSRVSTASDCFSYARVILEVNNTIVPSTQFQNCDELDSEDGISSFNLEDITTKIQTDNSLSYAISYYKTMDDALLKKNNLRSPYINRIAYSETIFARIDNENECYGISEVLLTVNELPNIETEELTYYCLNTFPQTITLSAAVLSGSLEKYAYNWSTGDNSYEIEVSTPGTYIVDVIDKASNCLKTRIVTVEASNIATFQTINIVDASQNNIVTVLVSGEGIYEYALFDNSDKIYRNFQTSNIFENVFPGIYTIKVKDIKNDCGEVFESVSVIGFPKFFTPNNDGVHDTWQVYSISNMFQSDSKILIFNRFGKLIKQLDPLGRGWDGSFNGQKLPTDDYWFEVTLQDGRIFKGHFTLKN